MNNVYISAFAASNVGKKRQNNEDNYCLNGKFVNSSNNISARIYNQSEIALSVCDGMGGEAAGEVASQIAAESVAAYNNVLISNSFSDAAINDCIQNANGRICEEITKRKKRMGTTFTLLGIKNGVVTVSNIGDSRVYRYADGTLQQLSRDHTEAQSMVDAGIISAEDAMKTPEKHRLTQHLGIYPYEMVIEPYTVRGKAVAGERFLLCSDGLTDMLNDKEISSVFSEKLSIEKTVFTLIDKALEKGGKDNVTVAVCELTAAPLAIADDYETEKEQDVNKTVPIVAAPVIQQQTPVKQQADNNLPIVNANVKALSQKPAYSAYESVKNSSDNKNSNKKYLIIIAAAIAFVGIIAGAFYAGKNSGSKSSSEKSTTTASSTAATEESTTNTTSTTEFSTTESTVSTSNSDKVNTTEVETTSEKNVISDLFSDKRN